MLAGWSAVVGGGNKEQKRKIFNMYVLGLTPYIAVEPLRKKPLGWRFFQEGVESPH